MDLTPARSATARTSCAWWPTTTNTRSGGASPRTAAIACSIRVFPPARCSTLAMRDFMRVPCPAARITTAASLSIDFQFKFTRPFPAPHCEGERHLRDGGRVVANLRAALQQIGDHHFHSHFFERPGVILNRHGPLLGVSAAQTWG